MLLPRYHLVVLSKNECDILSQRQFAAEVIKSGLRSNMTMAGQLPQMPGSGQKKSQ